MSEYQPLCTIPDKPNSRLQKYRPTDKGRQWLAEHGDV
jgi:hypothetical protein